MPTSDTGRTGIVFIDDFDEGMAVSAGGEIIKLEKDGELTHDYAIQFDGVTGPDQYKGLVPLIFQDPEDAFQDGLVPQVVLVRTSINFDETRWHPQGREYRIPAVGATKLVIEGVEGYDRYEEKPLAMPHNIQYEVHIRARLQRQANKMWRQLGRVFWRYGQIRVVDSEGDARGYYAFTESIDGLSEVVEISDRMKGYTLSVRVEGELDFVDPHEVLSATKFTSSVSPPAGGTGAVIGG